MQPHEVLGVRPGASRQELAAAFRRHAVRHHPDHGGDQARFQAGVDAYRMLAGARPPSAGTTRARADVVFHRRSSSSVSSLLRRARRRLSASRQP